MRQEGDDFLDHAVQRALGFGLLDGQQLADEADMGVLVPMLPGVVLKVLAPDALFAGEVNLGVGLELLEHAVDFRRFRLVGHVADKAVQQPDQGAVLVIDLGNAGLEVRVPRKNLKLFGHALAPV